MHFPCCMSWNACVNQPNTSTMCWKLRKSEYIMISRWLPPWFLVHIWNNLSRTTILSYIQEKFDLIIPCQNYMPYSLLDWQLFLHNHLSKKDVTHNLLIHNSSLQITKYVHQNFPKAVFKKIIMILNTLKK